jgi:hypothetical protein
VGDFEEAVAHPREVAKLFTRARNMGPAGVAYEIAATIAALANSERARSSPPGSPPLISDAERGNLYQDAGLRFWWAGQRGRAINNFRRARNAFEKEYRRYQGIDRIRVRAAARRWSGTQWLEKWAARHTFEENARQHGLPYQ